MKILALDLGKTNTVACVYEAGTGTDRYTRAKTNPEALRDLIVRTHPDRVVFEIGAAAGWLSDLLGSLGIEFQVANTSHPTWRWSNTKKKTDRTDALRLAQLSSMQQLPTVHVPNRHQRQWRSLIRYRHHLVRRQTQIKNRIRAIFEREGQSLTKGRAVWTLEGLATLHSVAKPIDLVGPTELWQGELWVELEALKAAGLFVEAAESQLDQMVAASKQCGLLQTIPGVGPRLAEIVVAILDDPHRFRSAKEVGAYAGLTPRQFQSGDSDRRGRISGQGNCLLRMMLVEIAWIGLRYNPWMRETYERVRRGSVARKKIAIVAVARRLLVRCWAMLRDETPWKSPEKTCLA